MGRRAVVAMVTAVVLVGVTILVGGQNLHIERRHQKYILMRDALPPDTAGGLDLDSIMQEARRLSLSATSPWQRAGARCRREGRPCQTSSECCSSRYDSTCCLAGKCTHVTGIRDSSLLQSECLPPSL